MSYRAVIFAVLFCFLTSVVAQAKDTPTNLLPGSDFETADASGWVNGWFKVPNQDIKRVEENGNHFVRLTAQNGSAVMQHEVKIQPEQKAFHLSLRVRYDQVRQGKKSWNAACVQMLFLDDKRTTLATEVLKWTGTSKDWRTQELNALVPANATKIKLQIALFDVASGSLDVDDLELTAVDPSTLPAPATAKADKPATSAPATSAPAATAPATQPLPYKLLDAQFKSAKVEGKSVAGWYILNGTPKVIEEKESAYLHLEASADTPTVQVRRQLPLNPDWSKVTLATHVRYKNVKTGSERWQDARIIVEFLDAKGKRVGSAPECLHWKGSLKTGWTDATLDYVVPLGATQMKIDPVLLQVASGILDIESLTVTVTESRAAAVAAGSDAVPADWQPALVPHFRTKTATRENVCLNGVWQIRPLGLPGNDPKQLTAGLIQKTPFPTDMPPGVAWGWGKVPATWPGSKDVGNNWHLPPSWSAISWAATTAVWYRRSVDIPADWTGRRITLDFDTPQSQVAVFVGERFIGRAVFPAGSVDITDAITPGQSAQLTLFVAAKPFSEQRLVAMNPTELYLESADLKYRGLCGDVFLSAQPKGPRLANVQLRPSVRQKQLSTHITLADAGTSPWRVRIQASYNNAVEKEWTSTAVTPAADGTLDVTMPWLAQHLWDIDAPHLYRVNVQLLDAKDQVADERQERLGFREMWLEGRDIILNGTPIHWRTTQLGSSNLASRSKAQMAANFKRMRDLGFNSMILDYDFAPGLTPTYTPMLEAADEAGVLLVFTIPSLLPWKGDSPDEAAQASWRQLTNQVLTITQNHPSVIAYSTNHNRLGYPASLNPNTLDGQHEPRSPDPAFAQRRQLALDAEAYIRQQDPTREVYHHSAGNHGRWETTNCYLNWMPLQERMDYVGYWAENGVKPLFLTEFGLPFVASFGRYRGPGVYRPTSDTEPLFIEYAASVTGARAYELNPIHEAYVDQYETAYSKTGKVAWGTFTNPWMRRGVEWNFLEIQSLYAKQTLRAMRTWGLSAVLPWEKKGVADWTAQTPVRVTLTEPAEKWTEPGLHPDFAPGSGYGVDETWFNSPAAETFKMTSLGETYRLVNKDVMAWIAGSEEAFTDQTHLYVEGQELRKQVVIINDLRVPLDARYEVVIRDGERILAKIGEKVHIQAGKKQHFPLVWRCSTPVRADICAALTVTLEDGTTLKDSFAFRVMPPTPAAPEVSGMALWDPQGVTGKTLQRLNVSIPETKGAISAETRALVIGREAITPEGAMPEIRALLERGGRVVVMEQSEAALTGRLGFRTATPSLRQVFPRVAAHPVLEGLDETALRDWHGQATLIPPALPNLPTNDTKYPSVKWLGFDNLRVWKVGNRGQVASVLIEKPQTGDFMALADGGFDLQYSPLLLARVGKGEILFCQMDVTGRTEADPAADRLMMNMMRWASAAPAASTTAPAVYVGDEGTEKLLTSLGAQVKAGKLPVGRSQGPVIFGPGVTAEQVQGALAEMEKGPGTYVFLFQGAEVLKPLGTKLEVKTGKVIVDPVSGADFGRPLMLGLGPAELHLRARVSVSAVATTQGWASPGGLVAEVPYGQGRLVFMQLDPRGFDYTQNGRAYVKLTHNHTRTLLARVLANAGVAFETPLSGYWNTPVAKEGSEGKGRWLSSYYLDVPQATDDPYRYYRW